MFADVEARLADIDGIKGRIQPAASLGELIARGVAPQGGNSAFILPLGIRGGAAEAATGLFIQEIVETLGIVLFINAIGDATGAKATDKLTPLRNAVIRRIVNWAPASAWEEGETVGVFRVSRGELVSLSAGRLIYQLDFTLSDQLRV